MFKAIKRWFESKRGKNTVIVVLTVALILSVVGQFVNIGRLITGTTGPGLGGYSCMPTCVENDGKFISMPGEDMASFGGAASVFWIEAPIGQSSFELGFFDGDSGKDAAGDINPAAGNWDSTDVETIYTLFADKARDGTGMTAVGQWHGNADPMPNNGWYNVTINNIPEARNPDGRYYYRLVASRPIEGKGINAFKVRSTGQLTSGRSNVVDSNFAIVGMLNTLQDLSIIYPNFSGDYDNPGDSTYTGEWTFYFDVPVGTKTISFWDGDFDRGTAASIASDTDDLNTVGIPPFAVPGVTVAERAGGQGAPADDFDWNLIKREPPARYEVIGPEGQPIFANEEPSGTEEWERFVVSSDEDLPDSEIDLRVERVPPGMYTLYIEGLDLYNTVWFRIDYEISDKPPECPKCPTCPDCPHCPDCPCQEPTATPTPEPTATPTPTPLPPQVCTETVPIDLLYVLDVSSSMGMLYPGSGSKLDAAKQAIQSLNAWLAQENNGSRVALMTFAGPMRGQGQPPLWPPSVQLVSGFTSDFATFNSALRNVSALGSTPTAHALNQVTSWLPGAVATGHSPVVILVSDGVPTVDLDQYYFDNYDVQAVSLYDAAGNFLSPEAVRGMGKNYPVYNQKAGETLADTMLAIQGLKAAMPNITVETIAVQAVQEGIFNDDILRYVAAQGNGQFFMAEDTAQLSTAFQWAYQDSACGTEPPPPPACTPRVNTYTVENTTNYPFYSIKFNYQSGTEIKNGLYDEFQFTLTSAQVAAITSFRVAVKSGRTTDQLTLTNCQFSGTQPCAPVTAGGVTVSFQGAKDNGDGTLTLTFRVIDNRRNALSNVAFGLPSGVKPSRPTNNGSYQSSICP